MNSDTELNKTFGDYAFEFNNIINDIFNINIKNCKKICYGNEVYYSLSDLTDFLNIDNNKNILNVLRDQDMFTLKQLKKKYSRVLLSFCNICYYDTNKEVISYIGKQEDNYIFVNYIGLYCILGQSKHPAIKKYNSFIYCELLPYLRKYSFEKNNNSDIKENIETIKKKIKIIYDTQNEILNQIKNNKTSNN